MFFERSVNNLMKITLFLFTLSSLHCSHLQSSERNLLQTQLQPLVDNLEKQSPLLKKDPFCKKELLMSYGLEGNSEPVPLGFNNCPAISMNCCTQEDQEKANFLFENQFKYYLERYYETYLISLKYVLGFSAEAFLLASKL